MNSLLLIIIGLLLAILLGFAMIVSWIRERQDISDTILRSIQEDLMQRENKLLMIALRLERESMLKGHRHES